MITRLYVDNYKLLRDFTFEPGKITLLVGENGVGKSTIVDVLKMLRDFVGDQTRAGEAFPFRTVSRHVALASRPRQQFVVDVTVGSYRLRYELQIEHEGLGEQARVVAERLTENGQPLFNFEVVTDAQGVRAVVTLYRDDHSAGPVFPADWSRSQLASVPSSPSNQKLTAFKAFLSRLTVVKPNPYLWDNTASGNDLRLATDAHNFASWYRRALLNDPSLAASVFENIEGMGLKLLRYRNSGDAEVAEIRVEHGTQTDALYLLSELSEGQRILLLAYTLVELCKREDICLIWDEMDNFISPREMQALFVSLEDAVFGSKSQAIIVSHHPEVINRLAHEFGQVVLEHDDGRAVLRKVSDLPEGTLTPYDLLARGWVE